MYILSARFSVYGRVTCCGEEKKAACRRHERRRFCGWGAVTPYDYSPGVKPPGGRCRVVDSLPNAAC